MRRYFGTDGVRGVVGADLTLPLVERLGRAFSLWSDGAPVLVGRDTRSSGPDVERALAEGLASGGSPVTLAGVLPTPAVALLAEANGAVVSASHNPAEYNGVKFFARGSKLTDEQEEEVEARLDAPAAATSAEVTALGGLADRYVDLACDRFGRSLEGLRIAVDCANGALSDIAPTAIERLGAAVTAVAASPNGTNINEGCGATDLSLLAATVRGGSIDLGVAFDGDGDRMLAVDAAGNEVDGDQILAILALHLEVELVVVTTMSNLGFHRLMAERGIRVVTTDVGDRYVLEALHREGGLLGGEQSGHVLYLRDHSTGDGLAAALLLCGVLAASGQTLADAASVMPRWPQAKQNVRVRTKVLSETLKRSVQAENERLEGAGRVLVRPSGTEPLVRILAEAESAEDAQDLCATMAALVEREIGSA